MGRPSLVLLIALAVVGSWMFFNEVPLSHVSWVEGVQPVTRTEQAVLRHSEQSRIRIATFNLDHFGSTKAAQGDVIKALAHIVSQFDVVALQEIESAEHHLLPRLVDEINKRQSSAYDFVIGPRVGRGARKEQFAFVYDLRTIEIDRYAVYTVNDPDDLIHSEPLVGCFRAKVVDKNRAFTFSLVNIHTYEEEATRENSLLRSIFSSVRNDGRFEDDVLLIGDFQASAAQLQQVAALPAMSLVVSEATPTESIHDNLMLDASATTEFTGRSGVFDFLRELNLDIEFASRVSRHYPVWAEFAVSEGGPPGRVAGNSESPKAR